MLRLENQSYERYRYRWTCLNFSKFIGFPKLPPTFVEVCIYHQSLLSSQHLPRICVQTRKVNNKLFNCIQMENDFLEDTNNALRLLKIPFNSIIFQFIWVFLIANKHFNGINTVPNPTNAQPNAMQRINERDFRMCVSRTIFWLLTKVKCNIFSDLWHFWKI